VYRIWSFVGDWVEWNEVLSQIDFLDDCCPDHKGLMWWVIRIGLYVYMWAESMGHQVYGPSWMLLKLNMKHLNRLSMCCTFHDAARFPGSHLALQSAPLSSIDSIPGQLNYQWLADPRRSHCFVFTWFLNVGSIGNIILCFVYQLCLVQTGRIAVELLVDQSFASSDHKGQSE